MSHPDFHVNTSFLTAQASPPPTLFWRTNGVTRESTRSPQLRPPPAAKAEGNRS